MATIRIDRHSNVEANPSVRRRIGWFTAAVITAWMTASVMAIVAAIGGAAPAGVTAFTVVATAGLAALLYRHFARLGHIDEPLIIALLICWALTLGLLLL
jgi:hypothetical protein